MIPFNFPGIILYPSYWFPDRERGKTTAFFMLAIGLASVFGIALINSVANIGGFFGATILGCVGLWSMAAFLLAGAVLAMATGRKSSD